MNDLVVKEVNLFGDMVVAAQDKDGNIWAGVKWFCKSLGLTEDQTKNEKKKIGSDIVLNKGGSNLTLPTNGGKQEVLCLRNDFIPLWLAKISITPNMKESNSTLVDKLVKYQLQAKDVLAAAFLTPEKPKTQAELILAQAQQLVEQEHRLIALEENSSKQDEKLKELESRITTHPIDYYTIAGYANLKGIRLDVTRANLLGHKAAQMSREYEYDIGKTPDARFGVVNTYHIDILETVLEA